MKIAIMQPTFCPWIGYFKMIELVDSFVLLDTVQFERRCWQSRNRIKLAGKEHWISLHLQKAPQKTLIKDMRLNNEQAWKNTLLKTLHHAYGKSVNFKEIYSILEFGLFHFENLSELNIFLIEQFAGLLKLKTPLIKASSLSLPAVKRENLLLEICKALKADEYLSPEGSKVYLEPAKDLFKNANINIEYFKMLHPSYTQQNKNFIEYLGIIDLLFNTTNAAQILNDSIIVNDKAGGGGAYNHYQKALIFLAFKFYLRLKFTLNFKLTKNLK